jgi:TRAP-type C4-dicarboxylate transport system permease small subunit
MAIITTYGVVRRYVFHNADNNAYLAICTLTLICVVLSWAEIQRLHRHIVVDYLSHRFPPTVKEVLHNLLAPILGLLFCGTLAWKSWTSAAFSARVGEHTITNIRVPVVYLKAFIVAGVMLLCLVLLVELISYLALLLRRVTHKKDQSAVVSSKKP